jgi:hypothetical protein
MPSERTAIASGAAPNLDARATALHLATALLHREREPRPANGKARRSEDPVGFVGAPISAPGRVQRLSPQRSVLALPHSVAQPGRTVKWEETGQTTGDCPCKEWPKCRPQQSPCVCAVTPAGAAASARMFVLSDHAHEWRECTTVETRSTTVRRQVVARSPQSWPSRVR